MPKSTAKPGFGRNCSVLLDLLRLSAALAVALTHLPGRFVDAGGLLPKESGNAAVCVFFVLSGFVIRYVTVTRTTTGSAYAADRASRIYSVVLPALLLTVVLEGSAFLHDPALYRRFSDPFPWSIVPGELLQAMTFTTGWWGWGAPPLSNGPFWSLSFECVYYALYGLLLFAPRARWILVPLLLLAAGPAIAFLFPVWLFGVALYWAFGRLRGQRVGAVIAGVGLVVYMALLFTFKEPVLRFLRDTSVGARSAALSNWVASQNWGQRLFHGATLHWIDRLSVSYFLTGTLLAVALLPAMLLLEGMRWQVSPAIARGVRLVADSTFTLYLLHLPLFIFVATMLGHRLRNWTEGLLLLGATLALSVALAAVFDKLKLLMRRGAGRKIARV